MFSWTRKYFQSYSFQRVLILLFLALLLYSLRSMINLILLTFIFTFLMGRLHKFLSTRLQKIISLNRKFTVAVLYIILVIALFIVIYKFLPVVTTQIIQLVKQLKAFYNHPPNDPIILYIIDTLKQNELSGYTTQFIDMMYKYATNVGKLGFDVFLSLILSCIYLLEKPRIIEFTNRFEDSKISAIFTETKYFGERFARSFGKVIEAQFAIAFVNSILSVIALYFMGFPQLIGLGLMIFFFGLVPVAGVFISLLPLCTVAYTIGGMMYIVYVIIMITVLHMLEGYVLNPKLMSSKTNLPMFYTFTILIFSEHFLGIWGLIIGIPIFMFFLDILDVDTNKQKSNK
ncbi:AI-2E family transporter [Ectobacillus sp. sgz5001026]|uniref:AI-2E family transporter n=1 Tax=Ectobacillus sp. sgz5001026 TaxID=3242473 RepID=UPI0036D3DB38